MTVNKTYLKLAIQKNGRLTEESFSLLRSAGLSFESYSRKLFATCSNFPLEILFVRDDDIPDLVQRGMADIGIIGENVLYEEKPDVKVLRKLGFGKCSLVIAVPKDSPVTNVKQLRNKKIATSYPVSVKTFFRQQGIPIEIVEISGSVEISPALGLTEAIADITATGSSLAINELRKVETIYESESVLIASKSLTNKQQLDQLLVRFDAVFRANSYKYVMMNAPESILPELKKLIPGLKSPTVTPLAEKGWISVQTVIKENTFWETIEKLKQLGASGIIVLPIEKMIV